MRLWPRPPHDASAFRPCAIFISRASQNHLAVAYSSRPRAGRCGIIGFHADRDENSLGESFLSSSYGPRRSDPHARHPAATSPASRGPFRRAGCPSQSGRKRAQYRVLHACVSGSAPASHARLRRLLLPGACRHLLPCTACGQPLLFAPTLSDRSWLDCVWRLRCRGVRFSGVRAEYSGLAGLRSLSAQRGDYYLGTPPGACEDAAPSALLPASGAEDVRVRAERMP